MIISRVANKIYRYISYLVGYYFWKRKEILAIYLRGSVASGDVVFGKSDIDLIFFIKKFNDPVKEAQFLFFLSKEYLKLRKICPLIGECLVLDPLDVRLWFIYRPYRAFEARNWKRLYGIEISFPGVDLTMDDILFQIGWKMFRYFYKGYENKDIKLISSIFTEVLMLIYYLENKIEHPILSKRVFIEHLLNVEQNSPYSAFYQRIKKIFLSCYFAFHSGDFSTLQKYLFNKLLIELDELASKFHTGMKGEARGEFFSYQPFGFVQRRYYVESSPLVRNYVIPSFYPGYFFTTSNIFKLYLCYSNPLEYYSLKWYNENFNIDKPPEGKIRRFIKMLSTRKELRGFPFGKVAQKEIYYTISQLRLFYDFCYIAPDEKQLRQKYKYYYGSWPFIENKSLKDYFFHDYPIMWEILEEIHEKRI